LKKSILSFLLCGAVLGASPITVSLLNAGNGAIDSTGKYYVGPYTLTLNGVSTPAMCMDDFVEDGLGDKWSANVTAANSSDYSGTYLGNSGKTMYGQSYTSSQIYNAEAYLFSLIIKPGSDQADIQEAAWVIMDPSNSTYSSLAGVQSYLLSAADNSPSFNSSGFNIVSDVTAFGAQEFMVSATPTPEPATMAFVGFGLLLAGGAMGLRRRKEAKA
jgi:hypothetical protein